MRFLTVAAVCGALLMGCARQSNTTIDRIFINGKPCLQCTESLMIDRNGLIRDESVPKGASVRDEALAASLVAGFPLDAVREERSATMAAITQPASIAIVKAVFHDGTQSVMAVPESSTISSRLSRWVSFAAERATFAATHERFMAVSNAVRANDVRSIVLEMHGCYGTCAIYVATFDAAGIATFHDRRAGCATHGSARVPFSHVLESASAGGLARLRDHYPPHGVDGFGASIVVDTRRGRFVSDGPDTTGWGQEFATTLARLDQIVRDTHWIPPIEIGKCEGTRSSEQPRR